MSDYMMRVPRRPFRGRARGSGCGCAACAASHPVVHRLAMRTGCRCPDCGRGARTATAFDDFDGFDEDDGFDDDPFLADLFDEAATRRRPPARRPPARPARTARAARPARPATPAGRPAAPRRAPRPRALPRPYPVMPPDQQALTNQLLTAQGFRWRQGARNAPVSVQDLVNFQRAGGVRAVRNAAQLPANQERMKITRRGQQMLANDPRFRHLRPMFQAQRGRHQLYHITEPGQTPQNQSHYVGKTTRAPGIRVLEHLRFPEPGHAHGQLVARRGSLDQLQVQRGAVGQQLSGQTHAAEVLLQHLHRPDWNDPNKHGFDEALELAW